METNNTKIIDTPVEAPRSPVKRLITGFVLLALLLIVGGAVLLRNSYQSAIKIAEYQSMEHARLLENTLISLVKEIDHTLLDVVNEFNHQQRSASINKKDLDLFMENSFKQSPQLDSLRIADKNGIVWIGSGKTPLKSVSMADRDYFIKLKNNPASGLEISSPLIGKISGKRMISFARRINDQNGDFAGCVYGVIAVEDLSKIISAYPSGSNSSIVFRMKDMTLLSRYSKISKTSSTWSDLNTVVPQWREQLKKGNSLKGSYVATSVIDGVKRIYSYRQITPYPFYVNVGVALKDALAGWIISLYQIVTAISLYIICASVIIYSSYKRWQLSLIERERLDNTLQSLNELNELFKAFIKNSPIYAYIKKITDAESIVLHASDNFYDMTGITADEMVGKTMRQIFGADFGSKITMDDQRIVAGNTPEMLEETFNDGHYISYKFPLKRSDGVCLLAGYTVDITDRKRFEGELVETRHFLQAIMDSLSASICIVNSSGSIVSVNAGWRSFANDNNGNIQALSIGINYLDLCESVKGDDSLTALECSNAMRELLAGKKSRYYFEYPCHSPNEERWFACHLSSFNHNRETFLVMAHENITDLKQAQRSIQEMQLQMLQNEKLASIGQLAAGVAHEINNPMAFIGSNMVTLQKYIEKYDNYIALLEAELKKKTGEELPASVQEMYATYKMVYIKKDIHNLVNESNDGVEHIKQIVSDLKTFARPESQKRRVTDFNTSIDSTLNIVNNELKYFATIVKQYDHDLPPH